MEDARARLYLLVKINFLYSLLLFIINVLTKNSICGEKIRAKNKYKMSVSSLSESCQAINRCKKNA